MKSIFLIAIVLFSIIIPSCNTSNKVVSSSFIQKRKYNKGYHLEWLANKGKLHPSIAKNEKISAKEKVLIPQQTIIPKKDSNTISETFIPNKGDDKLIASIDNGAGIIYQPKDFFIQEKDSLHHNNPNSSQTDLKYSNYAIFGFLTVIVGIFFLVILPPITLLIGILGVIFCILGLIEINQKPQKYLGAGFSILGIIIGIFVILFGLLAVGLWLVGMISP